MSLHQEAVQFDQIPYAHLPELGQVIALQLTGVNDGNAPLELVANEIGHTAFSTSFTSAIIGVGEPLELTVTYQPQNAGRDTAALVLRTNDPSWPLVQIPLFGVTLGQLGPRLEVEAQGLFGDVEVGTTRTYDLAITNPGTESLVVDSSGVDNALFSAGGGSVVIEPGSTALLRLGFTPETIW